MIAAVLVRCLRAYRFAISPLYGQVCRYHPSCSAYALEAVSTHGAGRGTWLAACRVARCHPWAAGGVDHVPGSPAERRYHQQLREESEASAPGHEHDHATVLVASRRGA